MKKRIFTILTALLLILCGCAAQEEPRATEAIQEAEPVRKLQFSVVGMDSPGYTYISREELGGETNLDMAYGHLKEVSIQLDGVDVPLPQAIRERRVTLPDILSYARQDVRNGFCQESAVSEHGIASYSFVYPECELSVTFDIYEMPDGELKQIEELRVYKTAMGQHTVSRHIVDESSKWGYFVDREDWGITFTVSKTSPDAITIGYIQQGGQQIGELQIFDYLLYPAEDYGNPDKFPGYLEKTNPDGDTLPIPLLSDASGQIVLDWSGTIGPVAPGEYYLKLSIEDIYEESDVHPLMENFYDKQGYYIEFTIE